MDALEEFASNSQSRNNHMKPENHYQVKSGYSQKWGGDESHELIIAWYLEASATNNLTLLDVTLDELIAVVLIYEESR